MGPVTIYSVMMAVIWYSVFVTVLTLLRWKDRFIASFSAFPLIVLTAVCVFRVFFVYDFPGTVVIPSHVVLPWVSDTLKRVVFSVFSYDVTVLGLLLAVWLSVAFILLLRLAWKYAELARFLARQQEDDPRLLSLARVMYAGKRLRAVRTDRVAVPQVAGFFSPFLIFPNMDMPAELEADIVAHELSHFTHGDTWIKLGANVMCCLLWWNPFGYLLQKGLDHSLELKCDISIISGASEERRNRYYKAIIRVCEAVKNRRACSPLLCTVGLVSTESEEQLLQRFRVGITYSGKRSGRAMSIAVCAVLIALLAASYMFIIQPEGYPVPEPGEEFFTIEPDTSYLVDNGDGTYALYVDGVFYMNLNPEQLEPFADLPIKED